MRVIEFDREIRFKRFNRVCEIYIYIYNKVLTLYSCVLRIIDLLDLIILNILNMFYEESKKVEKRISDEIQSCHRVT